MENKPFRLSVPLMRRSEESGMVGRGWGTWRGASPGSALVLRLAAGSSWGPSGWISRFGGHGPLGISQTSQPPSGLIPASFIKQILQKRAAKDQDDEEAKDDAALRVPRSTNRVLAVTAGVRVLPTEICVLYIRVLPQGIVASGGARFPATADGRRGPSPGGAGFPRRGVEVGNAWERSWR